MKKVNSLRRIMSMLCSIFITLLIIGGCGTKSSDVTTDTAQEGAVDARGEVEAKEKTPEQNLEKSSETVDEKSVDKDEKGYLENEKFKPCTIFIDGDDFIISDTYYDAVWKYDGEEFTKIAGADSVEDIYGVPLGGYNDGKTEEALFTDPFEITKFQNGYAVSDTKNDVVRYIHDGIVETLNAAISSGGKEKPCEFNNPTGLATDNNGNLYVSNTGEGEIIRITGDGKADKVLVNLNEPMGLYIFDGFLYIAETGANRIVKASIKEDKAGVIEEVAGSGEEGMKDGDAKEALFSSPKTLFVTEDGSVYVADTVNSAIRCIKDGEVSTVVEGNTGEINAYPVTPTGLCIKDNVLYVCDNFNGKIYEFEME
ncbi:hypothetical protein SAMN04487770_11441 [Butyrivibrio sp. ob235]|uniref:NHL domain-containing protein n=1 Tax=Butyrivibrio sp. ob235 TaxID=1761780 RepID=UPI0008CC8EB6|nr:hypothetical protein [Butyrivibrio sp. ob235]SEL64659.1 hypothetical protein SAMN04487770_11441 [Butyrivibrio sp. ob235]